jgi:WD40 repeat protein
LRVVASLVSCVAFALSPLLTAARVVAQQQSPEAFQAHTAPVNAAVYSSDGRYVITAGADQLVKIWDAKTGEEVRTLAGHTGQVLSVAVSPDDRLLVSAAADNTLRLWDVPQPDPLRSFAGITLPVRNVAVSPNGQFAVSVGDDKLGRVWRLADGSASLMLEGHTAEMNAAAVRGDNNQIATADAAGVIRLWGPLDGRSQGLLGAHVGAVRGIAFHPNNQQLVSAGEDGQLKIWQLPPVAPREFSGHTSPVAAVALNSNGQLAVTGSADSVRVFNPANGSLVRELPGTEGATLAVGVSPNNALAAAAGDAGVIKFWNLADGADRWRIAGHEAPIRGLAFHPDNLRLATAGDDGTIRVWRYPVAPSPANGHTADVVSAVFSANGQMAATVSLDKTVRGWNPTNGAALWQQPAGEQPPTRIAIRPDSAQLAVGDAAGELQLRSATDGTLAQTLSAHVGPIRGLAYHPGGEALATIGDDDSLKIWKLPLVPPQPLSGYADAVTAVEVTRDAKRMVAGSTDKSIRVFDADSGQQTAVFAAVPDAVTSLALRDDDAIAAAGHATGTIKLWNLADGSPWKGPADAPPATQAVTEPPVAPAELLGHDGAVVGLAFDPAGKRIASAGADGTLRLWRIPESPRLLPADTGPIARCVLSPDGKLAALAGTHQGKPAIFLRDLATGKIVQTLLGHEAAVGAIAFHHGGTKLVSGAADNTARVWNLADPKFPEVLKVAHPSAVSAVALSSDSTQLFSAAADNVIRCTNVADGAEVRTIPGHGGAIVALRVVGTTLFSGSADGTVRLWNTASGAAIRSINHGAAVTCFAVDPAGKTLVTGGADKNVKLCNVADGAAIATLTGHAGPLVDVGCSADGTRACSVSADGLWLWDVAGRRRLESFALPQGEQRGTGFHEASLVAAAADGSLRIVTPHLEHLIDAHAGGVNSLAFTPDGARIVSSGADKSLTLWSLADGKPLATFAGATDVVSSVAITPDGKHLLGGGLDQSLRVWPLPAAAQTQPVAATAQWEMPAAVSSLRLSGDGKRVALAGDDGVVRVWDWTIGRELQRFAGHTGPVLDAAISPDGQFVVSGSADKTARKSTLALANVAVLESRPHDLDYLPDGSQLVVAGESPQLQRWQIGEAGLTAAAKIPADGAKPEGYVAAPQMALSIRGDAAQIASLDESGRTNVWNAADGSLAFVVPAPTPVATNEAEPKPAAPESQELTALVPKGDVQVSADGKKLLVASSKQVRVIDAATGRFLERFDELSAVTSVAFSPDNQTLLVTRTGAQENAALLRCSLERVIPSHDGAVTAIAFTPDGNALLSGGDDKLVRRWNVADGAAVQSYTGCTDAISSVAIAKDGQKVVAGGVDKAVRIWTLNLAEGAADPLPAATTFEFPAAVRGVSLSFDNAKLAACSDDGVVRVLDLNSGVELERFTAGEDAALAVAFAPDNRTLVSGGADNFAHVWTTSLLRAITAYDAAGDADSKPLPQPISDLALANGGAQALTAGPGGVKQWNLADGSLLRNFSASAAVAGAEEPAASAEQTAAVEFLSVAVRGDNQQVVAADVRQRLAFWNLANGEQTSLVELAAAAQRVRYSLDNQKLVAVCADDHLRFFNPADAAPTYEVASDQALTGVAFNTDHRTVLTGGAELRQWQYASPTAIRTLTGHGGSVYSATFSPDGRWIASTSADQTVRIWDAAAGTQAKQLSGHEGAVYSSSFSPDGALLVSCGADKTVRLWDTLGGRQLKQMPIGDDSLYTVAFFPDGKRFATAGLDRKIYLVDALTGKLDATLDKHPDFLYRVAFNPAGTRLLSCGYGGRLMVWNATSGQSLFEHELDQVTNFAAFAPDGGRIVVAGGDGKARFVDLPANAK